MTAFLERDETHLGTDRIFTSPTATALYENLLAAFEKDATAVAAGAVLANDYITEAMIAAGQVSQAKLKTALNTINPTAAGQTLLSGGEYCFLPTVMIGAGSGTDELMAIAGGTIDTGAGTATAPFLDSVAGAVATSFSPASTTRAAQRTYVMYHAAGNDVFTITVRYVNSSPPYDLGQGEIPLFVFARVDSLGNVKDVWIAEDPPWAHNGPTKTAPQWHDKAGRGFRLERPTLTDEDRLALADPLKRQDVIARLAGEKPRVVEITQEVKNRDMPLIPHPWDGSDLGGDSVVMLPVTQCLEQLCLLHRCGESIGTLLQKGYVKIGNEPLNIITPPGVLSVEADWKLTA
jgi:hypothetical protein